MVVAVLGGVLGSRQAKANAERDKAKAKALSDGGVFMGPTSPTALDKVLQDQAKNYTNIFGQPMIPNVKPSPSTTDDVIDSTTAGGRH